MAPRAAEFNEDAAIGAMSHVSGSPTGSTETMSHVSGSPTGSTETMSEAIGVYGLHRTGVFNGAGLHTLFRNLY